MPFIYSPRHGGRGTDPARCRASVSQSTGNWFHDHQCTRKAVVTREVGGHQLGFCRQHDPEEEKRRDQERRDRWAEERRSREEVWARETAEKKAMAACKDAIEQIAAGHNDPRALAVETLNLFPGRASGDLE